MTNLFGLDGGTLWVLAIIGVAFMLMFFSGLKDAARVHKRTQQARTAAALASPPEGSFQCEPATFEGFKYLVPQKQSRDSRRAIAYVIGFGGLFFPPIGWVLSAILLLYLIPSTIGLLFRDPLYGIWNGKCPHCVSEINFHPPFPTATDVGLPCPICARQVIYKTGWFCRLID